MSDQELGRVLIDELLTATTEMKPDNEILLNQRSVTYFTVN
jgi:hypothetical protein